MSVEEQQQQEPNALPWDQDFCKVDNTTLFELIMVIILSLSLSFSLNCIKANRHNLISLCWYSNRFYYLLSFPSSFSPLQQRHLNNNINIISTSSQYHLNIIPSPHPGGELPRRASAGGADVLHRRDDDQREEPGTDQNTLQHQE